MPNPFHSFRARTLLAGALLLAGAASASAGQLTVPVDQAVPFHLPEQATTVVVGNPAIADAHVQDGRTLFVLGRTFGVTNVIAVDESGEQVADLTVHVRGAPTGEVTVHKGLIRTTFACAPVCERALKVGDAKATFDVLSQQTKNRTGLATTMSQGR